MCTRDADGDGEDDGFWTLRSKDCVDPPYDPEQPPSVSGCLRTLSNLSWRRWRRLHRNYPASRNIIRTRTKKNERMRSRLQERKKRRRAKQLELRKGALSDLQEAWDDWPPRLKRGRPPYTTKERQPAMIYVIECGAEFEVTGDKKKGLPRRPRCTRRRALPTCDYGPRASSSASGTVVWKAWGMAGILPLKLWKHSESTRRNGSRRSGGRVTERARSGLGSGNCSGDGIWRSCAWSTARGGPARGGNGSCGPSSIASSSRGRGGRGARQAQEPVPD